MGELKIDLQLQQFEMQEKITEMKGTLNNYTKMLTPLSGLESWKA